jgi:hypothetical protein
MSVLLDIRLSKREYPRDRVKVSRTVSHEKHLLTLSLSIDLFSPFMTILIFLVHLDPRSRHLLSPVHMSSRHIPLGLNTGTVVVAKPTSLKKCSMCGCEWTASSLVCTPGYITTPTDS